MKILLILSLLISTLVFAKGKKEETLLILNMESVEELPKAFRTMQFPYRDDFEGKAPSREGLDKLKASGSAQFSELSYEVISKKLNAKNLYIIDLREESHGFANGMAVSWYSHRNQANRGELAQAIDEKEKLLLNQLIRKSSTFYNIEEVKELGTRIKTSSFKKKITKVSNEKDFIEAKNGHYFRINVTDHLYPTQENIQRFIALAENLPDDAWLHFHCKEGMGRTTTFLIMYDMMKNAKSQSFEDILNRQYLLGGENLLNHKKIQEKAYLQERVALLKAFYEYCLKNQDNFQTPFAYSM